MESQQTEGGTLKTSKNGYWQWLGVLGGILVFVPVDYPLLWGNMSVYLTSYFYREHGRTSIASFWNLAAFALGSNIGSNTVPYVKCGEGNIFLISTIIVFNAAIICIYVTLKYGFTILFFSAFGTIGFCVGILEQLVFKALSHISSSSTIGRNKSISCSGFNFGPFVINLLIGFYMNPDNIAPGLVVDDMPIFDEGCLIDRVPYLIVALGASSFFCMFIGYCLLSFSLKILAQKDKSNQLYGSLEKYVKISEVNTTCEEKQTLAGGSQRSNGTSQFNCSEEVASTPVTKLAITPTSSPIPPNTTTCEMGREKDMSVSQILNTVTFYALFFTFGTDLFPIIFINASFKMYGLTFIKDDHFLINLASNLAIVGGITRIVWGVFLDRFAVKSCLMFVYMFLTLLLLLTYFAPIIDKHLYYFSILAISIPMSQFLPTSLAACSAYFGENNSYKVFGMIGTSRIPVAFLTPPVIQQLRSQFGWFGPFCCCASLAALSLVLIVLIFPNLPKSKQK